MVVSASGQRGDERRRIVDVARCQSPACSLLLASIGMDHHHHHDSAADAVGNDGDADAGDGDDDATGRTEGVFESLQGMLMHRDRARTTSSTTNTTGLQVLSPWKPSPILSRALQMYAFSRGEIACTMCASDPGLHSVISDSAKLLARCSRRPPTSSNHGSAPCGTSRT